jgi:TRAP-type C4-dicarboxylate transport system permease small subunit
MIQTLINKSSSFFSKLFALGAGASMFLVFFIIFVNSIRRYTLGESLEWGEELPVFIAIYGIMFGVAWAYMNDQHVRFTILVDFIPKKINTILNYFVDLIMVVTGVLLTYSGYLFALKRGNIESPGLVNISDEIVALTNNETFYVVGEMFPYQMAISIGGVMLAIAALLRLLNRFYEKDESQIIEIC